MVSVTSLSLRGLEWFQSNFLEILPLHGKNVLKLVCLFQEKEERYVELSHTVKPRVNWLAQDYPPNNELNA